MPILEMRLLRALNTLVDKKIVRMRRHPRLPINIFNYTPEAMAIVPIDWPEALEMARGLILDDYGRIVARPFTKFWNYGDQRGYPIHGNLLGTAPGEKFILPDIVYEKVDGSMITVSRYVDEHGNSHRVVASRGSFESSQAFAARAYLNRWFPDWIPEMDRTFVFEWISPENRIVVDYGNVRRLILLGVTDTNTGNVVSDATRNGVWNLDTPRFSAPNQFVRSMPEQAEKNLRHSVAVDEEGYVLFWRGRDGRSDFRLKIKSEDYVRMHKVITQTSVKGIWEAYKADRRLELPSFIDELSDFGKWFTAVNYVLGAMFNAICRHVEQDMLLAKRMQHRNLSRKQIAAFVNSTPYPGLVFAAFDEKTANSKARTWDIVWDQFPVQAPDLTNPGGE